MTMDSGRLRALGRHLLCIAALMWTALVNGQPFFFPDTTSYVRAGDLAVYLVSHGHLTTVWSDRYQHALKPQRQVRAGAERDAAPAPQSGANDLQAGNIMSGRSPFFGFLLYLGWVTSRFWLFVVAQAAVAYGLIVLAMRHFGLDRPREVAGVVLGLSALTSLPYFNSLLLADALAGFGIVAFLLLATDRGLLKGREQLFLWLVLVTSVASHLTHVAMLAGMVGMLVLLRLTRRIAPLPKRAWWASGVGLVAGVLAIVATSAAVRIAFDKPPKLVPLLTARFIADGPGLRFVRAGCDGGRFTVCSQPLPDHPSAQDLLWSRDPRTGFFMSAPPARRDRIAEQDTAFARAVLRAYPLAQGWMIVRNTALQLVTFQQDGLNQGCFASAGCWVALPPTVRSDLAASPSGRNRWPAALMTDILYLTVTLSILAIAARLPVLLRRAPPLGRELGLWIILAGVAMLVCAILGGGVSEPQYRYQGRLVWLIPFFASILLILDRRAARSGDVR